MAYAQTSLHQVSKIKVEQAHRLDAFTNVQNILVTYDDGTEHQISLFLAKDCKPLDVPAEAPL